MTRKEGLLLPGALTTLIVALGPALTVMWAHSWLAEKLDPSSLALAVLVLLVMWSPVFFSVPALLMQDARDRFMPHLRGVRSLERGAKLVPAMLGKTSTVRWETAASLLGLGIALFLAADDIAKAFSLLSF